MKSYKVISSSLYVLISLFVIVSIQSCKDDCNDDDNNNTCDTCMVAYKPNIYLYPKENIDLKVSLSFPKGGKVIKSIPSYDKVWAVNVEPTGKIDGKYDYLFYESSQPNVWQTEKGWCIKQENLKEFFISNLIQYGFSDKEIKDFIEYWNPRLNKSNYYIIYPQVADNINQVIQLNISETPDKILRLFYVIKESDEEVAVAKYEIPNSFERDGFYVTEWGVILE